MRADAPAAWNAERGFWALSRHAEVLAAESDPATFSSAHGVLVDEIGTSYAAPPTIMHTDPPAHTRYRRLVQPAFKARTVKSLEPLARSLVSALLDAVELDAVTDVVPALAVPFPLQVISELLGLPPSEWERCYEWSEAVVPGATDWPAERRQALLGEMTQFLVTTAAARRGSHGTDVLSELARVEVDGEGLSDGELAMFLIQLLVAGNETTRNLISAGMVALAEHPEQYERLRAEPALVPTAVEELLRWVSPVISFMRTTTRPVELAGTAIGEGEHVLLLFGSANRDETVFGPTAGALDVGRDPNPHLALGFGNHFCLGAPLARLEARIVLEELLARVRAIEPAGPVLRSGSSVVAGVRQAPLRLVA